MKKSDKPHAPPAVFLILISRLVRYEKNYSTSGDFMEYYRDLYDTEGRFRAVFFCWLNILKLAFEYFLTSLFWSFTMLKNYVVTAFRNLKREKGYSFINLTGLAVGLACFILIMLYVNFEQSFDKYHRNADNIYRVIVQHGGSFMETNKWIWTPPVLGPVLQDNIPEVVRAARVEDLRDAALIYGEKRFTESRFRLADPAFLKMFSLEFIAGNPETALDQPFSLIVTKATAEKYFGGQNPLGETIRLNDRHDFMVTGVIKNVPVNSHLSYDFLGSFISLRTILSDKYLNSWNNSDYDTYVELSDNADIGRLETRITECVKRFRPENNSTYLLQSLPSIHLSGTLPGEMGLNNEKKYVTIFLVLAVLILAIACFNYMNLFTARSAKRAREVGMRKIVGASRPQLIRQYLGESLIMSSLALGLGLGLVYVLLPVFNSIIDRSFSFADILRGSFFLGIAGITFLTGLVSGLYPAVFMSAFQPVKIIKGQFKTGSKGPIFFRNSLVFIQFIITIGLVVATIIVNNQLHFIRNRDAGFERRHIITMKINRYDDSLRGNIGVFKDELLTNPAVKAVTRSNWPPTNIRAGSRAGWEGQGENEKVLFHNLVTDYDFLELFGIDLIKGRGFSREITTDLTEAYIINETAAKIIGGDDVIGKTFGYDWRPGRIIGVVKDFNFVPLTMKIVPLAIRLDMKESSWLSIRLQTNDLKGALAFIKSKFDQFSPAFPFEYSFMDERFDALYREDLRQGASFGYFTAVAIFLACLGLFGLVSFTAEQKTREIGIRKVMGASVGNIIFRITREFTKWVVLSSLIAVPVSWYAMRKWIEHYAYRIDLGVGTFAAGVALTLAIAVLSVSYQAYRAAAADPAASLRNE